LGKVILVEVVAVVITKFEYYGSDLKINKHGTQRNKHISQGNP
jgi:hypothetical protein